MPLPVRPHALSPARTAQVPVWLLPPLWVLLGALVVVYVLGMIAFAVLAGLVASGRLLLWPVLAAGTRRRATGRRGSPPA